MRQRSCEILAKARTRIASEHAGRFQSAKELVLAAGQTQGFERRGLAVCVLAHQDEVASVRHEHQPVATPVAAGLTARRREPCVVCRGLHLHHAALWCLPLAWRALLHLLRGVEAEVGMARALVGQFLNAEHLRPECRADRRQEIVKRSVTATAPGSPPRRPGPVAGRRSNLRLPPSASWSFRSSSRLSPDATHVLLLHRIAIGGLWPQTGQRDRALHVGAGIRCDARGGRGWPSCKEDFEGSDPTWQV